MRLAGRVAHTRVIINAFNILFENAKLMDGPPGVGVFYTERLIFGMASQQRLQHQM